MEQVFHFIRSYNLITPNDSLLVAVSGGADSIALLSLMVRLRDQYDLKDLLCIHLNHQLRSDADKDEAFVKATAAALSVRYFSQRLDVKGYAQLYKRSIETAGRDCRLLALSKLAQQYGCTVIATGHHKNDTAETLVQRLARGTGFRGLCGIWPSRSQGGLRWIRPMLTVTHQEIQHYLKTQHISWCEDTTNREQHFRRNFIRHALLPHLLSESQDNLIEKLHDLSLACYRCYRDKIIPYAEKLAVSAITIHQNEVMLKTSLLRSEPPLILSEVIRRLLSLLGCGEQALTQKHYRTVMDMIKASPPASLSLPGHVHVMRHEQQLIFRSTRSKPEPGFPETEVNLTIPGRTSFGPYLISTNYVTPSQYALIRSQQQADRTIEVFDADRLSLPLAVRIKRPGDCFQPLGRGSRQKVGRFLNRARLPYRLRERIVLICDTQTIVWVCPIRMGDHAKVTSSSQRLVTIEIRMLKTDPETEDHFRREDEYP